MKNILTNPNAIGSKQNDIIVFLAPLNITQSLTDLNVLLGQNGTLSITCDAFPAPKVTW
jgi:hypothetical protein